MWHWLKCRMCGRKYRVSYILFEQSKTKLLCDRPECLRNYERSLELDRLLKLTFWERHRDKIIWIVLFTFISALYIYRLKLIRPFCPPEDEQCIQYYQDMEIPPGK